jgi:uncharacterized cupin superfamily protein
MSLLTLFRERAGEPLLNRPFFAETLEGNPQTRTEVVWAGEDGLLVSGYWRCTEGLFRMDYPVWEFCHFLEGECVITPEGGAPKTLKAGDAFICDRGLKGTWRVVKPVAKHFVIRKFG